MKTSLSDMSFGVFTCFGCFISAFMRIASTAVTFVALFEGISADILIVIKAITADAIRAAGVIFI